MAQLTKPRLEQILEFCAEDPVERVFLEDVARRRIGRFSAVERDGRLTALCHVGANVVPSGSGCGAFARGGMTSGARLIIGEERAVGELWQEARAGARTPRDDRPGQPVFEIGKPPEQGGTAIRAASPDDLDLLIPACAAAHEHELGVDPLAADPDAFRWRTRSQIDAGRSWLWVEDGVIRFKAEASAWTPAAVQLQQVWVDPPARRHGYAQRALRDLVRFLLERVPTVCLFSRADNHAAIRLYESIGMRRTITYRSILLA